MARTGIAVLGLAIIGTMAGGFAGASSVRASQARHRAAVAAARAKAAEDKARADYGQRVTGVADQVLATMQPVEHVLDDLNDPRPGVIDVVQDVLVRSGTSAGLTAAVTSLHAITAPASLKDQASTLVASADSLRDSYSQLVGSVEKVSGAALLDALTGDRLDEVRTAEMGWHEALEGLYGHLKSAVPAAPGTDGGWLGSTPTQQPTVPTKASWIAGADQACATAMWSIGAVADTKDLAAYVQREHHKSALVLAMDASIRKLALPSADADQLRTTVIAHLGANDAFARLVGKLGTDVQKRDVAAYDSDLQTVSSTFALVAPLQRGFGSYGATLCARFLRPVTPSSSSGGSSSDSPAAPST